MKKILSVFALLLFAGFSVFGQTFVSTDPSNKNVILEEYTGVNCGYCPDGHRIANQIAAAHPDRFWAINIHQGSYANTTPDYRTPFGDALAGQTGLTGYPAGTINRHVFSGSVTSLSRSSWSSATNTILSQSSCVNVAAQSTIDFNTRVLTVVVEVYYTGNSATTTNLLNVALLQDNILGPQASGATNPDQMEGNQYRHMHMLRHLLTGQWGETINTTSTGTFYTNTYSYTVPANLNNIEYVLEDLEVVVFISEGHQEIITGNKSSMTFLNGTPKFSALKEVETYDCNESAAYAKIRNLSNDTINSVELDYNIGAGSNILSWDARTINPGAIDTIMLPYFTMTSGTDLTLTVDMISVNGVDPVVDAKNIILSKDVAQGGGYMTLLIATDRYASETSFKIFKEDGSVLLSGGPWNNLGASGTTLRYFAIQPPTAGCYKLEVYDAYGDGINSGYGAGYVKVFDNNSNQIVYSDGQFGAQFNYYIYADSPSAIEENMNELSIYPNPANNLLNIQSSTQIQSVEVLNIQGQLVIKEGNVNQINVSSLTNGVYMIRIATDNGVKVQKFVKE